MIMQVPEAGELGHVHLIEFDQFIGRRYLVTTHGPLGRGVSVEMGLTETQHVLGRLETGRLRPATRFELSYAIVAAVAHRQGTYITRLASQVATLERRVREGDEGDPVRLLEELFLMRHELLSVRTVAAESREVYARMAALTRMIPPEAPPFIDFYQARTTTRTSSGARSTATRPKVVGTLTVKP